MVTGISEDSVTAFYIFFLIKNYQRIRKSEPADAIFYFFRTPTIDKEPIFFGISSGFNSSYTENSGKILPSKQIHSNRPKNTKNP